MTSNLINKKLINSLINAFIISQALREFTGDQGYIFDPEGFVTDEHGGNREHP